MSAMAANREWGSGAASSLTNIINSSFEVDDKIALKKCGS
jgi:hypothetical protein